MHANISVEHTPAVFRKMGAAAFSETLNEANLYPSEGNQCLPLNQTYQVSCLYLMTKEEKVFLNILMVYLIKTRKCKISGLHIILIIHTNEKLLDSAG